MKQNRTPLLLLLVILALSFFFYESGSLREQVGLTQDQVTPHASVKENVELPLAKPQRSEPSIPELPEVVDNLVMTAAQAAPAGIGRSVQGRVIGVEPGGVEHRLLCGEIVFRLRSAVPARKLVADFDGGLWKAWLEAIESPGKLNVYEVKVNGRKLAIISNAEGIEPGQDGIFEVRVLIPLQTILKVVDKDSGEQLSGIQLIAGEGSTRGRLMHPGVDYRSRTVAHDLVSPVVIDELADKLVSSRFPPGHGPSRVIVGVEGYAWKAISIDFDTGGEHTVSLEPGSSLIVRVSGVDGKANSQLRLRGVSRLLDAEVALEEDEEFVFDGLAPGPFRVSAEVGLHFRDVVVLGEETVTLEAGQESYVDLTLNSAPAIELAVASGIIHVAEQWSETLPGRILIPADLLDIPLQDLDKARSYWADLIEPQREGYRTYQWASEPTQLGSYKFHMYKLPFSADVEIPAGGVTDLEWVLGPPVNLMVHAVDASTQLPVTSEGILWAPHSAEPFNLSRSTSAEVGLQQGLHTISAPQVKIDVEVYDDRFNIYRTTIDLPAGTRETTIQLVPLYRLSIELWCQGVLIPFPKTIPQSSIKIAGLGKQIMNHSSGLAREIMLSEGGLFEIQLPKLPGYRETEVQTINVPTTDPVVHRVELIPE